MKLKEVTIDKYKNFLTKQTVSIEDGVTRLVGKNESGKTAFLTALAKYNYFDDKDTKFVFDKTNDYPRCELKAYEQKNPENNHVVISCVFEIGEELTLKIQDDVGAKTFQQKRITISRSYNGALIFEDLETDIKAFIDHFLLISNIPSDKINEFGQANTVYELYDALSKDEELKTVANSLRTNYIYKGSTGSKNDVIGSYIAQTHIFPNVPQFWYFDDYYTLPGQISLTRFNNRIVDIHFTKEQLDIAAALFSLAGISVPKLTTEHNYEAFVSELEATSNSITDKFLEYWSTNQNLEIQFEIQSVPNDKLLNIRIRNTKNRVTLPLQNRSKGFIWFFSFLVWFSRIENRDNVIILLDEPGLNLHMDAQSDLLRYIEKELAPKYQIIYTTHSPFMIDPQKLNEVRTVYESDDGNLGSVISDVLEEQDKATLFPLQAAIGYDIAQNLHVTRKSLMVEGTSDLLFVTLLSEKLRSLGKPSLDESVTIVPISGLDKVATFLALVNTNRQKAQIACLFHALDDEENRKITDLHHRIIRDSNIIFFDEFTKIISSDIEDMFKLEEYLTLFNGEFAEYEDIDVMEIDGDAPVVPQIKRMIGEGRFNRYRPANYLLRNPQLLDTLSEDTYNRFACAFDTINRILHGA